MEPGELGSSAPTLQPRRHTADTLSTFDRVGNRHYLPSVYQRLPFSQRSSISPATWVWYAQNVPVAAHDRALARGLFQVGRPRDARRPV